MIHLPENFWSSPVIKKRLANEATFECDRGEPEKPHYWCRAPMADTKDGSLILKNFEPSMMDCAPHEMQQEFARVVQEMLMVEAGFDGMWIVGWTHPPSTYGVITDTENCWGRLICIWLDAGGDPQFTLESDLDFTDMMESGEHYYVGLAHEGYQTWLGMYGKKALKEDMGLMESQMKHEALEALK